MFCAVHRLVMVGGGDGWPFVSVHVRRRPRKIPLNLCHRCIQSLGWCVGFSSIVEIPPSCSPLCASYLFLPSFSLSLSLSLHLSEG